MSDTRRQEIPQRDDDGRTEAMRNRLSIETRCSEEARRLTDDPLLRQVYEAHLIYSYIGRPRTERIKVDAHPSVHDGVEFFMVGHNASHQFYLGTKDGKLYHGACGEDSGPLCYDRETGKSDPDCLECYGDGWSVQWSHHETDDPGYIGHF
jgi:hypothetical protein